MLNDEKGLWGRNQIACVLIPKIKRYYGMRIRNNMNDLLTMKNAVWAVYFHLLSLNKCPQHGLGPSDINFWCKFSKAEAEGGPAPLDRRTGTDSRALRTTFRTVILRING
ncbi:hypothetical protein TNCV_4997861 [Trichonephila clavipes]|nr:hypothetical protein TNCV_4997861 [Trichonephila clavipes]